MTNGKFSHWFILPVAAGYGGGGIGSENPEYLVGFNTAINIVKNNFADFDVSIAFAHISQCFSKQTAKWNLAQGLVYNLNSPLGYYIL